jgi:hypothetical protein
MASRFDSGPQSYETPHATSVGGRPVDHAALANALTSVVTVFGR